MTRLRTLPVKSRGFKVFARFGKGKKAKINLAIIDCQLREHKPRAELIS
jgi:hypothetical protein